MANVGPVPDPADSRSQGAETGDAVLHCANHPNTETLLRCNRCGKPICIKCAVRTPVGYRCKECVSQQQAIFYTGKSYDYVIAAAVTLVAAALAGALVPWLIGLIGFYGIWLMIFIAPAVAGLIAEGVRRSVGRRRSRYLPLIVCAAAVIGTLLGMAFLWLLIGYIPSLIALVYVALLVPTLYARTR